MAIHIDAAPLLDLLGKNGGHWLQGSWGDDKKMCLHGAIRRCAPIKGDAYLVEQVAARQGWGTQWNDDLNTTWGKVRAKINGGIDVTDADLAETFGPQWSQIVALVRRCAILTVSEAQRLVAARDAARDAAGARAAAVAWAAALDAARAAARAAGAARDVARDAGEDAAVALSCRDLIGTTFTQQDYDLLTGPWRTVIGPIHPDDAPTEVK